MKKLTKTFVVVIICCSLTVATPLLAQNETNTNTARTADRDDDDNTGKWGLIGLLGLIGLAGLRKRDNDNRTRASRNP